MPEWQWESMSPYDDNQNLHPAPPPKITERLKYSVAKEDGVNFSGKILNGEWLTKWSQMRIEQKKEGLLPPHSVTLLRLPWKRKLEDSTSKMKTDEPAQLWYNKEERSRPTWDTCTPPFRIHNQQSKTTSKTIRWTRKYSKESLRRLEMWPVRSNRTSD